ncbi:FG-GAP repeat domain-containing protein [Prauserella oleivorans]
MNDDARDDIVVMDAGGNTISVLLNEGGGTFGKAVRSQTDTLATAALTIDDFNGDGHEDTAVSHPGAASR